VFAIIEPGVLFELLKSPPATTHTQAWLRCE
jgi:hypothetical protein